MWALFHNMSAQGECVFRFNPRLRLLAAGIDLDHDAQRLDLCIRFNSGPAPFLQLIAFLFAVYTAYTPQVWYLLS